MSNASRLGFGLLLASLALPAAAVPVPLTLDPATGGVNDGTLSVTGPGFSGSGDTNVSGTIVVDVTFSGLTPQTARLLNSSDLGFSDVSIGPGGILGGTTGVRGTASSAVLPIAAGGVVNLGGALLVGDEGILRLGTTNRDLAASPLTFTLDGTSSLTLTFAPVGNVLNVVATGPIAGAAVEGSTTFAATADVVTARGSFVIPEPAALLAALPAAGLLLRRRRIG